MPFQEGAYSKGIYYVDGLCAIQILLGRDSDPSPRGGLYKYARAAYRKGGGGGGGGGWLPPVDTVAGKGRSIGFVTVALGFAAAKNMHGTSGLKLTTLDISL
jgi:hypothetical protein